MTKINALLSLGGTIAMWWVLVIPGEYSTTLVWLARGVVTIWALFFALRYLQQMLQP